MYMSKSLDDTLGLTVCNDFLKSSNVIGRTCVRTRMHKVMDMSSNNELRLKLDREGVPGQW